MVEFFFGVLLETLCSSQFCEFELNLDFFFCISSCIISFNMFMHHIVLFVLYFFWLTCSLPLVLFLLFFPFFFYALVPYSSTMPRKTRANRVPSTPAMSPPRVQLFRNERAREAYEKLNSKCKIWAERSVILDEVNPAIRANLESRG